jgi:hypothetical protein
MATSEHCGVGFWMQRVSACVRTARNAQEASSDGRTHYLSTYRAIWIVLRLYLQILELIMDAMF